VPSLVNDGLGRPQITAYAAVLRAALGLAAAALALQGGGVLWLAAAQLVVSLLMGVGFLVWVHRVSLPWTLASTLRPVLAPNALLLAPGAALALWHWQGPMLGAAELALALLLMMAGLLAVGWRWVLLTPHRVQLKAWLAARRAWS
jgi:hypothetical protein